MAASMLSVIVLNKIPMLSRRCCRQAQGLSSFSWMLQQVQTAYLLTIKGKRNISLNTKATKNIGRKSRWWTLSASGHTCNVA